MKRIMLLALILVITISGIAILSSQEEPLARIKQSEPRESIQTGDIIFQINVSGQGKAVQLATGSKYTHVGVIFLINNKPYVAEAVQPVKFTPLNAFIARGDKNHYVIKRLKNTEVLSEGVQKAMLKTARTYEGKDYDLYFNWDDRSIYCSELVWKIYKKHTGYELGKLQEMGDFNLDHPLVKAKLAERYGKNIPYDEKVISPGEMFNSELLRTVESRN